MNSDIQFEELKNTIHVQRGIADEEHCRLMDHRRMDLAQELASAARYLASMAYGLANGPPTSPLQTPPTE